MASPYRNNLRHKAGFPGSAYEAQSVERDFTNANPQVSQVANITIGGTVASGDVLTATINGEAVSVTAAGASKADIAAALVAAISQNLGAATSVSAVSDGTSKITITGNIPGEVFDFSAALVGTGTITTPGAVAAVGADEIPFGRLIVRGGDSVVDPYPNRLGKLPSTAGDITDDTALCISLRKYDEPGSGYAPNSRCAGMHVGAVVVELVDDGGPGISDGDTVYITYGSGTEGGFSTVGASAKALDASVATFRKYLGDGLAVVDCRFH